MAKPSEEKVACRSPDPGKSPTNIPKWKYDLLSSAIRAILKSEGVVYFSELPDLVRCRLSSNDLAKLGSVSWHVTTVKLEMETSGDIKRLQGKGRQQLCLA